MDDPADLALLRVEFGVRQLYARYADAVWRQDVDAFSECFTEDAVWKIAGRTLRARAEIAEFFRASVSQSEIVTFWPGIPVLDLSGDRPAARVQVTELMKRRDGNPVRTLGLYYDRFEPDAQGWRLTWHHYDMTYFGPPDLSGPLIACPDYGPPPAQPRQNDPSTVR